MHQPAANETANETPRRRWGDGIRRRRLQRAQSAPVGSPSSPCNRKQDPSPSKADTSSSEGTNSLVTLLEGQSKELLLRRPDRISITYAPASNEEKLGLRLRVVQIGAAEDNKKGKNKTCIQIDGKCRGTAGDSGPLSQMNSSALRDGSQHSLTFFEPGDVLEHVNDLDCRHAKNLGEINTHLEHKKQESARSSDDDGQADGENMVSICPPLTTIAVSTSGAQDSNPPLSALDPKICQAIALRPAEKTNCGVPYIGIQFGRADGEDTEESGLLTVRKLLCGGWFNSPACAIKEGDFVVGINEYICSSLAPDDAQVLLEAVSEQSTQLSITTLSLPDAGETKSKLAKLRKAAVAAGGGSLVVVGGALMVTPLHPIGHAMALGGVGVLSTEYEAPKRAMRSAKSRLKRSPTRQGDTKEADAENVSSDENVNSARPPEETSQKEVVES